MQLGIQLINSDSTLNNFQVIPEAIIVPGSTATVRFQLIKLDPHNDNTHRYIPAAGASLQIKIYSVNTANIITKTATQPWSEDKSVWEFSLNTTETQKVSGVNLELTLTEGAQVYKFWAKNVLSILPASPFLT